MSVGNCVLQNKLVLDVFVHFHDGRTTYYDFHQHRGKIHWNVSESQLFYP